MGTKRDWALLFKWQQYENANAIHAPGSSTRVCIWGEGFFDLAPDPSFLELLGAIGITAVDPRPVHDPHDE